MISPDRSTALRSTDPPQLAANRRALVWSGVVHSLRGTEVDETDVPVELSDEARHFLCTRLREDLAGLTRKAVDAVPLDDRTRAHRERAAATTAATLADLESHRPIEHWTVRLLLLGYSRHPKFRHEWATDSA